LGGVFLLAAFELALPGVKSVLKPCGTTFQIFMEKRMADKELQEKNARESLGWLTLAFMMLMFPVLFFVSVWLPMWFGFTTPY